jgi:peptide/nickel transport system substrate-binding protein
MRMIHTLAALLVSVVLLEGVCFGQVTSPGKPQKGGILREIWAAGPRALSYLPEMGPADEQAIMPAAEKLMDYNSDRELVPFLAESVDVAKDGKTITFTLRKGITFHDGSEFNAEAVAWNLQFLKDTKRLQYQDKLTRIEVVDNYTVRLHLWTYTNQLLYSYGWIPIFSKQAWEKAGNGNPEKSKEWARANIVATGPFKLGEYRRDNYLKWVRNDRYWQHGKPYLDGIEARFIPDPVTASAMMQAKEVDYWYLPPIRDVAALDKKGFRNSYYFMPAVLFLNTKDTASKFRNLKVREAVEYALDRPAMAKALGFGYYTPLTAIVPPGQWGYDPSFAGRPYNPAKAKQLLAEAGYDAGLTIKLLSLAAPPMSDWAQAIKGYLDQAGMTVDLDLADPGRFYGSLYGTGWPDMALFASGQTANFFVTFHRQFGPDPWFNYPSFAKPPELMALAEKSLSYRNESAQKEATKQFVKIMYDEALIIPLFLMTTPAVYGPNVHVTFPGIQHITRYTAEEWMDK